MILTFKMFLFRARCLTSANLLAIIKDTNKSEAVRRATLVSLILIWPGECLQVEEYDDNDGEE